jgi:hypothetical protein
MIIDNDPPIERHISVPRDMSQLSCSSFTAGIVEAVLDGLSFVRVTFLSKANLITLFAACPSYCTQYANFTISQSDNYIDQT